MERPGRGSESVPGSLTVSSTWPLSAWCHTQSSPPDASKKHYGCVSLLTPAKVPHLSLKCVIQTHYTAVRWCAESGVTGAQTEMVITRLQPAAKKRPLDTRPTWYKIALLVSSHSEANPRQLNLKRCQFKAMHVSLLHIYYSNPFINPIRI